MCNFQSYLFIDTYIDLGSKKRTYRVSHSVEKFGDTNISYVFQSLIWVEPINSVILNDTE